MPTKEQRAAKIERIASCPRALHDAVNGLSDEQLDTPYRYGGWTCRQVVHHVADSHMNAFARFRWVITEDNTTIKTYTNVSQFWTYDEKKFLEQPVYSRDFPPLKS